MSILEILEEWTGQQAQDRLDNLPHSQKIAYTSDTWSFRDLEKSDAATIDFSSLEVVQKTHPDWAKRLELPLVELAKRLFIRLIEVQNPPIVKYPRVFDGIALFLSALASENESHLNSENAPQILAFMLSHRWQGQKAFSIRGVKSQPNFHSKFNLSAWKTALRDLGLDLIDSRYGVQKQISVLKKLLPELTEGELSYADWFQGGSFNSLTLDYGRFYVEHCLNFFETHWPMAYALEKTAAMRTEVAHRVGITDKTLVAEWAKILQGIPAEDLREGFTITTRQALVAETTSLFNEYYHEANFISEALKDGFIQGMNQALGVPGGQEHIDRMRVIIWEWSQHQNQAQLESLLRAFPSPVALKDFCDYLGRCKDAIKNQTLAIPQADFYQSVGVQITDALRDTYPARFVDMVRKAGMTGVMALTGWRRSEFGFPLSALIKSDNEDKLDQYAFPFRYRVKWVVPKTHGKAKINREITFGISMLMEQINELSTESAACLFQTNSSTAEVTKETSGTAANTAMGALWVHFVENYEGFRLLDDLESLKRLEKRVSEGQILESSEVAEYERLLSLRSSEQWHALPIDVNLKDAWIRLTQELPLTRFHFRSRAASQGWLTQYLQGTLREDWQALLDENLSDETKDWLNTLSEEDLKDIHVARKITSEVMGEALYPRPHAFRHMWAEAVYRRFDGDAGWLIRSQFKHIAKTMWLAYIRNKDNRGIADSAQQQVINSLVFNYLAKRGEGYSGAMHKTLRRLMRATDVKTPEEQVALSDQLANVEIESIKANPWGYCLLKRRTRHMAKCAEFGEPNRVNAAPELCLGCSHNLMQENNVEWSIFHIAPHVAALNNPKVPGIFKRQSFDLVKKVAKNVRQLDASHPALAEIEEALNNFKKEQEAA